MPDPADADDPWGDLYRDLEVDAAAAKPAELIEPATEAVESEFAEGETDEGEFEPDDTGDEDEPTADGDNGTPGESEPKKRRRRRRRRKKKGGVEGEPVPATAGEGDEETVEAEDDEPAVESLDETSPETAREVIATWNVPSWPEIVAGLYRPDRG